MKMSRWVVGLIGVVFVGCSGDDLQTAKRTGTHGSGASAAAAAPDFVAGVRLAHVDLSATHKLEFWEIQPGNVMMIQSWDGTQGDRSLDLERELLEAGGTFGALYRKLLDDPGAKLSPELIAADERRSQLPIQDAFQPLPAGPASESAPREIGSAVAASPLSPSQPGALSPLGIVKYNGGGIATFVDPSWCSDSSADGGWCPPGAYYGFANGNLQRTMYFRDVGHNPQAYGSGWDYLKVNQWLRNSDGSWSPHLVFNYGLAPQHSVEAYCTVTGYFQGAITGDIVSYAERWRLPFPSLSQVATHPGTASLHWTSSNFANDIQGISHDPYNTILSRTEYTYNVITGVATPQYGVMGVVAYNQDMDKYAPSRFAYPEPAAWRAQGYTHYGDIAYANVGSVGGLRNGVYISLSKTGGVHGGIGVWSGAGSSGDGDRGTVEVSPEELAWLAINPKNGQIYASSSGSRSIQAYSIHFPASGTSYPPPVLDSTTNINLVNGPIIGGINGGKVSRHGKLWLASLSSSGNAVISGVDPYTGVIQTVAQIPVTVQIQIIDPNCPTCSAASTIHTVPSDQYFHSTEVEGLDLTDPNDSHDLVIHNFRPGISGNIHVQVLGNNSISDDAWELLNFQVSDLNLL